MTAAFSFRPARPEDLDALVDLEQRCFDGDRLSRRSFRHWIRQAHSGLIVAHGLSDEAGAEGALAGEGGEFLAARPLGLCATQPNPKAKSGCARLQEQRGQLMQGERIGGQRVGRRIRDL